MPLAETEKIVAAQLVRRDKLTGRRETLLEALAAQLGERFQLLLDPPLWADKPLISHLHSPEISPSRKRTALLNRRDDH